jgi:hypothetical protein
VDTPAPSRRIAFRPTTAAIVALLLAGAALRLAGLNSELWFDEIVSVRAVAALGSLGRVLWAEHTDNKHHLTWAWIWLIGPGRAAWAYRLTSYLAGVAVLPLLYAVARQSFGRATGLLAMALATFCYPLVCYSSEARGYALAVLAGVAAYGAAPRPGRPASATSATMFGVLVVAGFASHLTFAYVYAGLLAWAAVDVLRRPSWAKTVAGYHGPALIVLATAWWFDVSRMTFAGGPPTAAVTVLAWLASLTVGTPVDGPLPWVAVGLAAGLCGYGLVIVNRRQGAGGVAFFIVALVVAPAVLTATRRTPFLAVRYYLVVLPFVLLLSAVAITALPQLWRRAGIVVVTAAVAMQGVSAAWQLNGLGRGHVRAALARMATGGGATVTFASDRPVMDRVNVAYYADAVPGRRAFVDRTDSPDAPQWWVLDLDSPALRGPDTIYRHRRAYELDSVYPSDPVSGLTWDLYRRASP